MALSQWRKKAKRKAYDQKRRSYGKVDASTGRESKREYARRRSEASLKAEKRYASSEKGSKRSQRYAHSENVIEARKRYKKSNVGIAAQARYAQSEAAIGARRRYSELHPDVGQRARVKYSKFKPEIGIQARKKYDQSKPEIGIQARKKYDQSMPEIGIQARKKYDQSMPEIGIQARKKYNQSRPEVGIAARTRYAHSNPKVAAAASKRYRERRNRKRFQNPKATAIEKDINRQRRFLHLLPSREYSFVGGRAFVKTGRLVSQQKMVRKLLEHCRQLGKEISITEARRIVQRAINLREEQATSLKGQALALKEICEKMLNLAENTPNVTLNDLCGDSGHEQRREPFFYDFAYKNPTPRLVMKTRRYKYAVLRAKAARAVWLSVNPHSHKPRHISVKVAQAKMKQLRAALKKKAMYTTVSDGSVNPTIALGTEDQPIDHPDTWPCDHRCHYPEKGLQRLTDILRVFTNVSQIRCLVASGLDSCSNMRGCHPSTLTYPSNPEQAADWSETDLEAGFPSIQNIEKLGHSIACLPENCHSRLLFLRQLAVHFKRIDLIVRRIYRLILADKKLQKIDEALIRGDYQILKSITAASQPGGDVGAEELQRPKLSMTPEEEMEFLPYTKQIEKAFSEKAEFACASCCTLHYRKQVSEIFLKSPVQRKSKLRPLQYRTPTLHVGGKNRKGPPWNRLWEQLHVHLLKKFPGANEMQFFLCSKCYACIRSGEDFSPLSIFNDMEVDEVPPAIADLNEFERLCIQLGKCFQVICRLGSVGSKMPRSDRLKVVKGQVLYYPLPISETIRQLSECAETAPTLEILLNSVPTKNGDIWQSVIRLEKIKAALQWLKTNNPLYKDIDLHKWLLSIEQLFVADRNLEEEDEELTDEQIQDAREQLSSRGAFPKAPDKPMLKELNEDERVRIMDSYTLRPLDSELPQQSDLKIYQMTRIEADKVDNRNTRLDLACFPGLFPKGRFGQFSVRRQKVTSSEFIKNRLMHEDARFRRDHQYLFHLLWDSELRAMTSAIYQTLRNTSRFDNMPIEEFIKLISEGNQQLEHSLMTVFRNVRGSPEYWKAVKMKLLCMIRELGSPTWFLTLSAAEFDWEDMSDNLRAMNSDLPNVDKMRTSTLTSLDPVMTQNHFHHRFVSFFNEVILNKENPPLGLVWDYFWRIEYQCRGHIHYHILLWVKDAPQIGVSSDMDIKDFINKHATCRLPSPLSEPILHKLVTDYQMHRCSDYCLRSIKTSMGFIKKCRFGFPRPVQNQTGFRDTLDVLGKRRKGRFDKRFYDLPRTDSERRINDYNARILLGWQANVDVSFIGESTTALANYVCGYVTKGEKGATELWESIDKNEAVWKQLYAYAFAKLRNRECGIIEAIDRLRGQPLYGMSRQTMYINARMPSSRTVCMKSWSKLQAIRDADPTSTDKYEPNWIDDFYPNRPETEKFEQMCLYDFRRLHDKIPKAKPEFRFKNARDGVKPRSDAFLISHPLFKKPEEVEAYRYSLLLLFKPFRNETAELLDETGKCSEIFRRELEVNPRLSQYHEKLQAQVAQLAAAEEAMQKAQEIPDSPEMEDAEPLGAPSHIDNAMSELLAAMAAHEVATTWEEDRANMNSDQARVFDNFRERISDPNGKPFCEFVSGEGGTGKSFLIHTIKKFMRSFFFEAETPTMAIAGPTGLAAFNVSGITLHRLFKLPVQHGQTAAFFGLNRHERKQLAGSLRDLKLLVIDETSMVSNLLLLYIDKRLQEIFRSKEPFGGKSLLVFGDFTQLKPVNAPYIFERVPGDVIVAKNLGVGSNNIWERDFTLYDELRINMRQKDDPIYAEILGRLRFGAMTAEDVKVLEKRLIPLERLRDKRMLDQLVDYYFEVQAKDRGVVCLFPKSHMVDEFNSYILQKEGKEVVQVLAIDKIHGYQTKAELARARARLQQRKKKISTTAGIEMALNLAVGARVMLRRNIDVEKGLVNGAIGTIQEFIRNADNIVMAIKVLFDNEPEPQIIDRVSASFNLNSRIVVFLQQLPVILAYSITIHKSQGISLNNVIVDAGNSIFQAGMMYVGLSRVKTLQGLHLINLDPKWAKCSKFCIREINRLRRLYAPRIPEQPESCTKLPSRKDRMWYCSNSLIDSVDPSANFDQHAARDISKGSRKRQSSNQTTAPISEPRSKKRRTGPMSVQVMSIFGNLDELGQKANWTTFSNTDGFSCYANCALHLLFSCRRFCEFLAQPAFGGLLPVLQKLNRHYIQRKNRSDQQPLSTIPIRSAIGSPFLTGEQDVMHFLEEILKRVTLEALFQIACLQECTNSQCSENVLGDQEQHVHSLVIDPSAGRTFSEWLRVWQLGEIFECVACHLPCTKRRFDLANPPDQILLTIARHAGFEDAVIPGCDPDDILIGGCSFRVIAVVQHFPFSTKAGHYVALLRTGLTWVKCDDERAEFSDFPFGLESVYVMLLEKKTPEEMQGVVEIGNSLTNDFGIVSDRGQSSNKRVQSTKSRKTQFRGSSRIKDQNLKWPFFSNSDGTSCYANSAVHLLFASPQFCFHLALSEFGGQLPLLQKLYRQYEKCKVAGQKNALSTVQLRKAIGAPFLKGQQDAAEFIEAVLAGVMLEGLFAITCNRHCTNISCHENHEGVQKESACFVAIDPRTDRDFQSHLLVKEAGDSFQCHACRRATFCQSFDFSGGPEQFLIKVVRHTENGFDNRPIVGCNPDKFSLGSSTYQIKAVIQHFGSSSRSGHYVAILRTDSGWLRCNDKLVEHASFPVGLENAYLILAEKLADVTALCE